MSDSNSRVQRVKIAHLKQNETNTITLAIVLIKEIRDTNTMQNNYKVHTIFSDEYDYILLEEFEESIIVNKFKVGDIVDITVHDIIHRCGPYPNEKNIELDQLHISQIFLSARRLNPHYFDCLKNYKNKIFTTKIFNDILCVITRVKKIQGNSGIILLIILTFL